MKKNYVVGGRMVELEPVPNLLGIRFKEPAQYSTRSEVVQRSSFTAFQDRIEIPREKFTVVKISATPQLPEMRLESAVTEVSSEEAVERVAPVFDVGGAFAMATDRVLVGFKSGRGVKTALKKYEILEEKGDEYVIRLNPKADPFDVAAELLANDNVEYAEPDFVNFGKHLAKHVKGPQQGNANSVLPETVSPAIPPGYPGLPQETVEVDTFERQQYALTITKATEAWQIQVGNPEIVIAILDEGVETSHPDLAAAIVGQYDAVDDDLFQEPKSWDAHGTACAGLAAAIHDNDRGVKGIGGGCSLMAVRIAYSPSSGANWFTSNSWIKRAIDWSWENGADILSNSWGGGAPSTAITNAFERARTQGRGGKGAVVVIAAGNDDSLHSYPGNLDNVLTVSASNEYDEPKTKLSRDGETWWGSSFGPKVDVAAPGVHNYTTDITGANGYNTTAGPDGDYIPNFNGTSSSTPIVAGAVGLVLSANPDLTEDEVRSIIRETADKVGPLPYQNGRNDRMGHGRVNVMRAVQAARQNDELFVPSGLHSPVSNVSPESEREVTQLDRTAGAAGTAKSAKSKTVDGREAVGASETAAERRIHASVINIEAEDLPNIATASYTPVVGARTVHGEDDRRRITNTSAHPWRMTASLLITARDDSRWIGTGWFIGPNTLATAGHVVFIHDPSRPARHGWVRQIEVMPGRNEADLPYGSTVSEVFHSVTGWTEDRNPEYDYGAMNITTNLGDVVGWFGFGVLSREELLGTTGNLAGYPGDKPSGTLWYDSNRIASVSDRKVFYDIDSAGGQSGSAVYQIQSGERTAFGVHAYGGPTTNSATRITTPVYQNLTNWNES